MAFKMRDVDDKAHAHPTKTMPCQPCLGLVWKGEVSKRACVWGKVLHSHPLRHVLTPYHPDRPLLLKLEPCGPNVLINNTYAVANTHVHKNFDMYIQLTFSGKWPPK